MVTVSGLYVHPVKSCAGISLKRAHVDDYGIVHDREWLIVDEHGKMLTQRVIPKLCLIGTSLEYDHLKLSAKGVSDFNVPFVRGRRDERMVQVWDWRGLAQDEGDDAARWLESVLHAPCRLARRRDKHDRRTAIGSPLGFADGFPFLGVSQASLDDFAAKAPAQAARFRPNIVVDGCAGKAARSW